MGDRSLRDLGDRVRRPRVLVAEDDEEMRRLVAETLRRNRYDVLEVEDGSRLIAFVAGTVDLREASPIDLIVSDIRMPGCNGLDLLAALRRLDWSVPVILMTAFGDDETRSRAAALGALLFDKPFHLHDLRVAVRRSLSASP
jgi:DNA-binding response OmpR family regulator